MKNKKPPFEITDKIITLVAEISELSGKFSTTEHLSSSPVLRRSNRIRTIYSSLAIEQNILTEEQVTAVISGKRVIAPPKDIKEVQNAYEIYEHLDKLNPYSVEDLLTAHKIMTKELINESGVFRSHSAGVVDNHGNLLHLGTLPQYIPDLIFELMDWLKTSPLHMLVKSCVFHYEFEVIHPFSDGNGRIGRLWHTLLLSNWNPLFLWLPVESIIHNRQREYYDAINKSNEMCESTVFIEFMLSVIKETLLESLDSSTSVNKHWDIINKFLQTNSTIQNADLRTLLGISSATANRILARFVTEGKLKKIHQGRVWCYKLKS